MNIFDAIHKILLLLIVSSACGFLTDRQQGSFKASSFMRVTTTRQVISIMETSLVENGFQHLVRSMG